jgi:predicted DNA-binding transcriptional regulator AlpA
MHTQSQFDPPDRLLRLPEARAITGHGRTAFLDAVNRGELPTPVRIGQRAVAWHLSELTAWIAACPSARTAA